jgi:hypothetical protein
MDQEEPITRPHVNDVLMVRSFSCYT